MALRRREVGIKREEEKEIVKGNLEEFVEEEEEEEDDGVREKGWKKEKEEHGKDREVKLESNAMSRFEEEECREFGIIGTLRR
ncbi:hypothetical protein Tco_1017783 [Tanacetum coccineum]|uniref:Uncharacterized protein n=1 Tax=Tanacetum coccineum TaxID=301880 RepID=A0ABQ5FTU3_9ASTR